VESVGIRLKPLLLVVFATLFAATFLCVVSGGSQGVDDSFLSLFYAARNGVLTAVFRAVTFCGDQATVIVLCAAAIALPGRMKAGLPVTLMVCVGALIQSLLKDLVARPRPAMEYWLVAENDWMGFGLGYSFPSGHANTSLIFWVALAVLLGRYLIKKDKRAAATVLRVLFTVFALLIGLSRIYLGVHYPSDVFAGWMLGGTLLFFFFALYDRFWPSRWRIT